MYSVDLLSQMSMSQIGNLAVITVKFILASSSF